MTVKAPRRPKPELVSLDILAQAAECLRTLAHPHRLRMVQMLLDGSYTVGQLAEACEIPSPMASGHLRLLERCGLLRHRRAGREGFYEVAEPCLRGIIACIQQSFSDGPKARSAPR
jgi:ArsR family transcriptional regulator, zinc-responsive transcriptional repressor